MYIEMYIVATGRSTTAMERTARVRRVRANGERRAKAVRRDLLTVETSRGAEQTTSTTNYEVAGRGGRRELLQRGQFRPVEGRLANSGRCNSKLL
jgi:hypothetical protein